MHFLDYWSIQDNEIAGYSIHLIIICGIIKYCFHPAYDDLTMLG